MTLLLLVMVLEYIPSYIHIRELFIYLLLMTFAVPTLCNYYQNWFSTLWQR